MSAETVRYAGLEYFDRTSGIEVPLRSRPGVELRHVIFEDAPKLFRRQAQAAEFEIAEMSLATFIAMVGMGDRRLVGLPVFPSRSFRHGQIFVSARSGITDPAQLRGAVVGVPDYQMTAAMWVRAFLEEDFGVSPREVKWRVGGLRQPGFVERLAIPTPADVDIEKIDDAATLEESLASGEIDALISVRTPSLSTGDYRKLFTDSGVMERAYFARTGIFPIMHLVVMRRDIYEETPDLAAEVTELFESVKRSAGERMRREDHLAVGLPWLSESLTEIHALFDGDPFPYGLRANRSVLEAALSHSYNQGMTKRLLAVDDLFAPEALRAVP